MTTKEIKRAEIYRMGKPVYWGYPGELQKLFSYIEPDGINTGNLGVNYYVYIFENAIICFGNRNMPGKHLWFTSTYKKLADEIFLADYTLKDRKEILNNAIRELIELQTEEPTNLERLIIEYDENGKKINSTRDTITIKQWRNCTNMRNVRKHKRHMNTVEYTRRKGHIYNTTGTTYERFNLENGQYVTFIYREL